MKNTIYALGFFDGVHLGHQALLKSCYNLSRSHGCSTGVVTFAAHPDTLVRGNTPRLINSPRDREWLLREKYHVEILVTLPFDAAMRSMPWEKFLDMLRRHYDAAGFVCGEDFRFGRGGEGTAAALQELCQKEGLPCRVVEKVKVEAAVVSSREIRRVLEEGQVEKANILLGHPHLLVGTVGPGKQLGRTIGVPTANLFYSAGRVKLPYGVYACRTEIGGKVYAAVTNIGIRPTVEGENVTVEPWILDFEGDLYGQTLRLELLSFLRPEQKFPDLAALKAQIAEDALLTREIFEKTGPNA